MVFLRSQRCCQNVVRRSEFIPWVRCASGTSASSLQSLRSIRQRSSRPYLQPPQQRLRGRLNERRQRVSVVKGSHGDERAIAPFAAFEEEITKPDDDIDLPKAAALLALHVDDTVNTVNVVMNNLSTLKAAFRAHAAEVVPAAAPLPETARQQALAGALCDFFRAEGFEGCSQEDYYKAENSLLHLVLTSKRGIPISLALLYREVGSATGLHLKGMNFPGHFLLAFGDGNTAGLVDAFTNSLLSESQAEDCFARLAGRPVKLHPQWSSTAAVPNVVFLRRMALNLQNVYQRDGDKDLALRLAPYAALLDTRVEKLAQETAGLQP